MIAPAHSRAILVALALCACTTTDTPDAGTDAETGTAGGTGTDDGDQVPKSTMFGTIRDTQGATLPMLPIALCDSYGCKGGQTEADGTYAINHNRSGPYSFVITGEEALVDDRTFSLVAIVLDGEVDREYDGVALRYTHFVPMPQAPEEIEVAPGLLLTVEAAAIEADYTVPHAVDDIGGVVSPPEHRMESDGLPPIHAMWHLAPYEAWSTSGLPLRIRNEYGFGDGETYEVWEVEYSAQAWRSLGLLTVAGEFLEGDARVGVLNTVVLTDPS